MTAKARGLTVNIDMASLFSSDFVEVHPDGEVVTGQQRMDQVRAPNHELVELHPDNIQVQQPSPGVALLTDTTTICDKSGTKFNGLYRVIRVKADDGEQRLRESALSHPSRQPRSRFGSGIIPPDAPLPLGWASLLHRSDGNWMAVAGAMAPINRP